MTASFQEIKEWLEEGKENKSSHLMIGEDSFNYENYPIFCKDKAEVEELLSEYRHKHDRVKEIYDLSKDIDEQLNQHRVWNI